MSYRVPKEARQACEAAGVPYRDSLHAAGHAILNVMPLYMTCNPSDICTECENPYAVRYRPERCGCPHTWSFGNVLNSFAYSFITRRKI